MESRLISFETAKLAKEAGFNEPCNYYYNESGDILRTRLGMHGKPNNFGGYYAAPTVADIADWFVKNSE